MTQRIDGRKPDELRPIRMQLGFLETAEGSCWIEYGKTRVLCTASFQDSLPSWKTDSSGWVTAEYGMLPKSSKTRISREINKPKGRTAEIQRLIGRAIRAVTDFEALGNRMVNIDCDVIQADGGTRTAAVTGAMLAFWEACHLMSAAGIFQYWPIRERIAAVSVGQVHGVSMLDLCYSEDSTADVDMNVVLTESGKIVEIQGTAESSPFSRQDLDEMFALASQGISELLARQAEAIHHLVPSTGPRRS
ncbi:MAG: ribonuclease PH [Candidatus Omnitrophica bacterium]|nr:ribonuclease PH [bacterium]MBV6482271.1 Ribonuclease PH [bacterium]MBW7938690.1 ribonuclease PH [Candidatus Omnitrophota bacterium]MCE7909540.1 ribonuclease PH [Candidatus Omnitrophica bacterium COP1]